MIYKARQYSIASYNKYQSSIHIFQHTCRTPSPNAGADPNTLNDFFDVDGVPLTDAFLEGSSFSAADGDSSAWSKEMFGFFRTITTEKYLKS